MLMKPPEAITKELLDNIPYPITLQEVITNIIPVYPVTLSAFKILKKENRVEVLNFPFNPPITPVEFIIRQALENATQQTQQKVGNNMIVANNNNQLAEAMMNIIFMNRSAIEGETGLTLEEFLTKQVELVKKVEKESSLLIADTQGNVEGDVIEIVIDF